jgi:hypothetical protein
VSLVVTVVDGLEIIYRSSYRCLQRKFHTWLLPIRRYSGRWLDSLYTARMRVFGHDLWSMVAWFNDMVAIELSKESLKI